MRKSDRLHDRTPHALNPNWKRREEIDRCNSSFTFNSVSLCMEVSNAAMECLMFYVANFQCFMICKYFQTRRWTIALNLKIINPCN